MRTRRIAVLVLSGALVVGGTGAAIAAVTKDDAKKAEQAILDDAAKRLNVAPEKLRDALSAAQDAQLDQAVEDGDLTQKQADAMLDRIAEKVSASGSGKRLRLRGERHRFHGAPPPGAAKPGSFVPGAPDAPDIAIPADGVIS